MQKRVSSNEQNGKKNTPEEDSKPSKLVNDQMFWLISELFQSNKQVDIPGK